MLRIWNGTITIPNSPRNSTFRIAHCTWNCGETEMLYQIAFTLFGGITLIAFFGIIAFAAMGLWAFAIVALITMTISFIIAMGALMLDE
jgi:hypothetical protein